MDYPFVLLMPIKDLQWRRKGRFPQWFCGLALVAQQPGMHESGFNIELEILYHAPIANYKRNLTNIELLIRYLYLGTIFVPMDPKMCSCREKRFTLLIELMATLCPPSGTIFDGYGGVFTTALETMKTGR